MEEINEAKALMHLFIGLYYERIKIVHRQFDFYPAFYTKTGLCEIQKSKQDTG